jgi:hypothetical protein
MGMAVKKTISLPPDLAREAEEMARQEGKTLSAVVQEALRMAKKAVQGNPGPRSAVHIQRGHSRTPFCAVPEVQSRSRGLESSGLHSVRSR